MKKTIRGSKAAMESLEKDFRLTSLAADRLIAQADKMVYREVRMYGVTVIRRGDDYTVEK